jgi:hypothetical protein
MPATLGHCRQPIPTETGRGGKKGKIGTRGRKRGPMARCSCWLETFVAAPPLVVKCRSAEIRRVVRNLVENAIKYGHRALVSVSRRKGIVVVVVDVHHVGELLHRLLVDFALGLLVGELDLTVGEEIHLVLFEHRAELGSCLGPKEGCLDQDFILVNEL